MGESSRHPWLAWLVLAGLHQEPAGLPWGCLGPCPGHLCPLWLQCGLWDQVVRIPDRPPVGSCLADFSTQVNSSSLNSPPGRGSMAAPSLHPSLGPSLGSSLGSPGQLHSPISTLSSPINGMGPPFSVISSPMGPHSMSVPTTPTLGFGAGSPQVSAVAALGRRGRGLAGEGGAGPSSPLSWHLSALSCGPGAGVVTSLVSRKQPQRGGLNRT